MDPVALRELIIGSATMKLARGGTKSPVEAESATSAFAFASVVAIADIQAGDTFTVENIWVKRPGTGEIHARDFESLLGNTAASTVSAGEQVSWSMVRK